MSLGDDDLMRGSDASHCLPENIKSPQGTLTAHLIIGSLPSASLSRFYESSSAYGWVVRPDLLFRTPTVQKLAWQVLEVREKAADRDSMVEVKVGCLLSGSNTVLVLCCSAMAGILILLDH